MMMMVFSVLGRHFIFSGRNVTMPVMVIGMRDACRSQMLQFCSNPLSNEAQKRNRSDQLEPTDGKHWH